MLLLFFSTHTNLLLHLKLCKLVVVDSTTRLNISLGYMQPGPQRLSEYKGIRRHLAALPSAAGTHILFVGQLNLFASLGLHSRNKQNGLCDPKRMQKY